MAVLSRAQLREFPKKYFVVTLRDIFTKNKCFLFTVKKADTNCIVFVVATLFRHRGLNICPFFSLFPKALLRCHAVTLSRAQLWKSDAISPFNF